MGYRVHQARAIRAYLRADPRRWILATTDSIALPLLSLKSRGLLANPVLHVSVGLYDRIERGLVAPRLARRYAELTAGADAVLVYAPAEAAAIRRLVPGVRADVMPFGVEADWWTPPPGTESRPGIVFSVGRDPARDFPPLAAAVHGLEVETRIMSRLARTQGVAEGERLRIVESDRLVDLRDELWRAHVVAIPIRRVGSASGETSALQAMAAGRPVVMTDSGWAAHHGLRSGEHFLDVPAEDADALREAIVSLVTAPDEAARLGARAQAAVRERFSTGRQADAILAAVGGR
jgi:glycosyltransferase involved in cell wall biosynthesis